MVRRRLRLFIGAAVAVALFLLLPKGRPLTGRILVAWDVGAALYLMLAWTMLARSSMESMQKRAQEEDEGAMVILAVTVAAAIASLGAIGAELVGIHDASGGGQATRLIVAGLTILLSWCFVHTVFAVHYAHEYYGDRRARRGLTFPGTELPDYWDFMYFSFTMGAAAQTSDVAVTSRRMRRLVLGHTVLSFLFNTTVLALAINVGAGLLSD